MKIILASDQSFLLKYGYNLTGISVGEMKVGYVVTASRVSDKYKKFVDEVIKEQMKDAGISYQEFDLAGKNKEEIRSFFRDKNVIHVEGGNTFYLLKIIRETGFSEILKEFLNQGKVYIGTSAGAYIVCPTIEVANWNEGGKDRFGVTDFTALDYVPFVLKVHYTDDLEEMIRKKMKDLKYPLRILRDGQGIIVDDKGVYFIGESGEIVLI